MPKQNSTSLLNFRHRVVLSSSRTETVPNTVDIVLVRKEIQEVWASINPVRGAFYLNGFALLETRNNYSHNIYIRYNRNIDITGYGWIYENRPSGLRWYKIMSVQEQEEKQRYWEIQARLVQKSDDANPPGQNKDDRFVELPSGAKL